MREAVAECHRAGATVKMCTGDNVLTARSIASQCGIFTPGGIIMEGPTFRQLNDRELLEVVPRLQVLARSSPEDKKILVEKLRTLGEIVAVTGDGANVSPALKTAHIAFSMGITGTEMAKEASDIILTDDNFSSIVTAMMWGRCVNDAVRKFLQFQICTNMTAVVVTFVTAVTSTTETSVLSAVQLLWVNLIMDTFATLALATDPASTALLDRNADRLSAPLLSVDMYKQIFLQSTYQIIIILIFNFLGLRILGFDDTPAKQSILQTLVFNVFVLAQIFNSINCRRLDRKLNVFEGLTHDYYFLAITLIGSVQLGSSYTNVVADTAPSIRICRSGGYRISWRHSLSGHPPRQFAVGHLAWTWHCLHPFGCPHSLTAQRTIRATVHHHAAPSEPRNTVYRQPRR